MYLFLYILVPPLGLALAWLGVQTIAVTALSWLLILIGVFFSMGTILSTFRRRVQPAAQREEKGDRSFWLILPGFLAVFYGAPLEALYLSKSPPGSGLQVAGLLFAGLGIALLVSSFRILRGQFKGHIQIHAGHRLVTSGPYHIIRHPGYLGYLLLTLGIAAGYASLVGPGSDRPPAGSGADLPHARRRKTAARRIRRDIP